MEIHGGTAGMQLHIKETPKRGGEGRMAVLIQAAVPDQHGVGLEARPVGADVARKGFAADLLLTLDHEAQVDRRAAGGKEMLDRLHGGHVVALVVRSAAREKLAFANLRLER